MDINQVIQLVLAVSVSFAVVAISLQIAILVGSLSGMVKDARKPVQNVGELSDLALEDYKTIRRAIYSVKNLFSAFKALSKLFPGKKGDKTSTDTSAKVENPA